MNWQNKGVSTLKPLFVRQTPWFLISHPLRAKTARTKFIQQDTKAEKSVFLKKGNLNTMALAVLDDWAHAGNAILPSKLLHSRGNKLFNFTIGVQPIPSTRFSLRPRNGLDHPPQFTSQRAEGEFRSFASESVVSKRWLIPCSSNKKALISRRPDVYKTKKIKNKRKCHSL